MRTFILHFMIGFWLLGSVVLAGDDDLIFELKAGASLDIDNVWTFTVTELVSYNRKGSLFAHETDFGLVYDGLADWVTVSWNFRYLEGNPNGDNWFREYRPHFNVAIRDQIGPVPWSNRVRIEYRDFDELKDHRRLRNFLLLEMPFKIPVLDATSYIGDEVFVNLSENGYNQNRLYTGLKFNLMERIKVDLYYYWLKLQRVGRWDEASILGFDVRFNF